MATTLKLEIVTPEGVTCSEDVELVTIPGVEGEMGIYPLHVPLMTEVKPGGVMVRKDGQDRFLAIGEGFAEITGERVSILTSMATPADNIDEKSVEEARRRAEDRLKEKLSDEELAATQASLARSAALLQVKKTARR